MNRIKVLLCWAVIAVSLFGCSFIKSEKVKLRDLEFTVLSEEMLSQELKAIIEERKAEAFKLTYRDGELR